MPDPNTPDFSNLTMDEVFNLDEPLDSAPPQETPAAPPAAPPEPFLRTSTGTIYNTPEDAVRGTEEKDRKLDEMRRWAIAQTGYDPISGKPVRVTPQQENRNYMENPEQFYDDVAKANGAGDKRAFTQAYLKLLQDSFLDPYRDVLSQTARSTAVDGAARLRPEIKGFVGSENYTRYLDDIGILKSAIEQAESRPEFGAQLRDLYVLAYDGYTGRSVPDLLKSANTTAPQSQPNTQPNRPSLQPVTAPRAPQTNVSQDISTPEGRKAIMDAAKSRGLDQAVLFGLQ